MVCASDDDNVSICGIPHPHDSFTQFLKVFAVVGHICDPLHEKGSLHTKVDIAITAPKVGVVSFHHFYSVLEGVIQSLT